MTTPGFEYKQKRNETPFETFLRYTNEKEHSATKLADILQEVLQEDAHILDVGTGNGEYLETTLAKSKPQEGVKLTLIEPSLDLAAHLKERFQDQFTAKIVNTDLQHFESDEQFDVILMSHLFYHIPRTTWTIQLTKALALLKPKGKLIIVLREKDDAYDFKMAFKPLLFDSSFKALTIDDVLAALPEDTPLEVTRHVANSELKIPYTNNQDDTVSIIEFYLNKQWEDIPQSIQHDAMQFIERKKGVFAQRDGIAVVKKGIS